VDQRIAVVPIDVDRTGRWPWSRDLSRSDGNVAGGARLLGDVVMERTETC
jgi:hypothetical protein